MKIFKKEKEVTDLALEYLDKATRCVATGENAVLAYLNGELTDAATAQKETADLESAADAMRRLIADRLFSGAYLPLMRGDIFKVIEVLDKMPNAAESCSAFFVAQKPQVPEEMLQAFVDLTTESFGSMKELRRAVKAFFKPKGDIEKIRDCARNVSVLESSVDDKEWELTLAIFESETLDLSHKRHLQYAVDRIVHLSDIAENVADRLELAAMKSVL